MKSKLKDERIEKKANEIYAKLYLLMLVLTIIIAVLKWMFLTQNITDYILEVIAITGSIGYLLIQTTITKIPLLTSPDECIQEIQNRYRKTCFDICFKTYIFGELILMFVFKSTVAYMYVYLRLYILLS